MKNFTYLFKNIRLISLFLLIFFGFGYKMDSQVLIPFSGNNSIACGTNTGLCTHAGCGATYSNNANGYTVINSAGTAVINISGSYSTESGFDYIRIYSGSGTGGTLLQTYQGSGSINYTGSAGQTLTVQFTSDGSVTFTGLNSTVTFSGSCSGGGCLTCPSYNFGPFTPTTTPATHSSSTASGAECKIYAFNVVSGMQYVFTTCSNGGAYSGDSRMILYNSSCTELVNVDDFCGYGPQITWTATYTGTAYIRMAHFSMGGAVSWTLAYWKVTPPGDNCTNPQDLSTLSNPYSGSTEGYTDDISVCRTGFPDRIFYIDVPNTYILDIWEPSNGYDEWEYVGYGATCPGAQIQCWDNDALAHTIWTNTTGSTQRVWWIQDAFSGSGTFNLQWTLTPGCTAPAAPASCSSSIGTPANGTEHHTTINCAAVSGADGYSYDYSFDNVNWNVNWHQTTSTTVDVNNGDSPNSPLYYRVRAYKCSPQQYSAYTNSSSFPIYTACDEPAAPIINSPTASTLNVTLNSESPVANPAITTYSIFCVTTGTYVTATGALGSETFQTKAAWGTITVTGLTCNTSYTFYAKARNNQGDIRYNAANTGSASTTLISGHYNNPEIVTSGNSYARDNTNACKTNQVLSYSCSSWNESAKEHWFQIAMTAGQVLDVQQTTASVDIDYFITNTAGGSTCYDGAYGDAGATAAIASSGNYYISCDGYNGASGTFTLLVNTVNPPTLATADPATVCSGIGVNLTASGGGGGGAVVNWYSGSCGGTYVGSGSPLTVYPTATTTFYASYSINGKITSCVATASVTVIPLPAITGEPSNSGITYGDNTSFTVAATNGTSYQWQEFISSWNDIVNGGVYSGATTASLYLTKPPVSKNGNKYRCVVSGTCSPPAVSNGNATLNVTPKNLTITANSGQYKYYSQSDPVFTYNASGFVPGEDAGVLTGALSRIAGEGVGNYAITIGSLSGANYSISFNTANFEVKLAYVLNLTAFLQSPYNSVTGQMSTALNASLPANQPFNTSPWNYNGSETLPTPLSPDAVDWVLVELRSDENTMYERKAGLLYKNGSVSVSFSSSSPSGDYVVIWHRGHMPVMSSAKVTLPIEGASHNLSSLSNLYGNESNPAMNLGGDVFGMIAGDVTQNGLLKYSGPENDRGPIIARIIEVTGSNNINGVTPSGYWQEDVTMNGVISYLGTGNDRAPIISNLGYLIGTPYLNNTYESVVPGVYTGGGKEGTNDGPVNIDLSESTEFLSADIVTDEPINDGIIDNIQFTLAWKTGDSEIEDLVSTYSSAFDLQSQGEAVEFEGNHYLTFASISPTSLPQEWNPGETVTVLSFAKEVGQFIGLRLWIADNEFTSENNGEYYLANLGTDITGVIQNLSVGINDPLSANSIRVYPNPVNTGTLYMDVNTKLSENLKTEIWDMTGKLIKKVKNQTIPGPNTFLLDVSKLNEGLYLIQITGDEVLYKDRIVIE